MTTVLSIIEDVLRSGEPQLRRNGAVALAAAASRESLARLAGLALDDPDESVRACAEAEIQSLPADSAEHVAGVLFAALEKPAADVRSYALLGRVRSAHRRSVYRLRATWCGTDRRRSVALLRS